MKRPDTVECFHNGKGLSKPEYTQHVSLHCSFISFKPNLKLLLFFVIYLYLHETSNPNEVYLTIHRI